MAEVYNNAHTFPPGRPCVRHWVHPMILVGGNVNDQRDWVDLAARHGIRSVVNADARSDSALGIPSLCEVPMEDNGEPLPAALVRHAVSFALVHVGTGPLYVHCHIGVSRSPAIAYGIMRWMGLSREAALAGLNSSGAEYGADYLAVEKHRTYVSAVEAALTL